MEMHIVTSNDGSLVFDERGRICLCDSDGNMCYVPTDMLPPNFFQEFGDPRSEGSSSSHRVGGQPNQPEGSEQPQENNFSNGFGNPRSEGSSSHRVGGQPDRPEGSEPPQENYFLNEFGDPRSEGSSSSHRVGGQPDRPEESEPPQENNFSNGHLSETLESERVQSSIQLSLENLQNGSEVRTARLGSDERAHWTRREILCLIHAYKDKGRHRRRYNIY